LLANFRARLTYANVMATVAVFIALGGSSYAAVTITGKNVKNGSLTGKDIKNSSLTGRDVKNNSLTGADIKNIKSGDVSDGSLLARDFKAGQLPAGPKGDKGETGSAGSSRGYADIFSNGTLDTAHSKNVNRAVELSPGRYCLNFTFTPINVVATIRVASSFPGQIGALIEDCTDSDGNSYNTTVNTADSTGQPGANGFYILGN
jgi:hypothetical protein